MTFTSACNYAKKCAAESAEITPDEIEEKTKRRQIVTARYVAMALMKKHTGLTDQQISIQFCLNRKRVQFAIKTIQGHIELYNNKSFKTDVFIQYQKAEWEMGRLYKPRYFSRIPKIK